jgi:hypothetical protein
MTFVVKDNELFDKVLNGSSARLLMWQANNSDDLIQEYR